MWCMFVVVAGSLRVLLPCVCVGAFVRAYLMLTLIWTVGSHFFSLIIFLPFFSFDLYTFSPAELSSERREKKVLADSNQPTAPPSTKSHVSYCAARARRREKMAAEGTSSTTGWSLLQSVLVSAVDSCHCPHPSHPSTALLPIAPLSLSDQVWCIQRCDCVNCT